MPRLDFVNKETGKCIWLDIEIREDTNGEKYYRFTIKFEDGSKAITHYIINIGKKYQHFDCFIEGRETDYLTPHFYMSIEPDNLFTDKDMLINKVTLATLNEKRKVEYDLAE